MNTNSDNMEESKETPPTNLFEILCRHKDPNPTNLNKLFDSYGCSSLEAKVPVVVNPIAEKLMASKPEEKKYTTLALKSASATAAMEGRHARTRNRQLKIIEVAGETLLSAGEERDRSPVDRNELDSELDSYMRDGIRLREMRGQTAALAIEAPPPKDNSANIADDNQDDLDKDLEAYMSEGARKKAQQKILVEQSDRLRVMENFDDYEQDENDEVWD